MKLKKVVALCNKAKGFRLFDKLDSTGKSRNGWATVTRYTL